MGDLLIQAFDKQQIAEVDIILLSAKLKNGLPAQVKTLHLKSWWPNIGINFYLGSAVDSLLSW